MGKHDRPLLVVAAPRRCRTCASVLLLIVAWPYLGDTLFWASPAAIEHLGQQNLMIGVYIGGRSALQNRELRLRRYLFACTRICPQAVVLLILLSASCGLG